MPTFGDIVGAIMALAALGIVGYAAVMLRSEQALGAIMTLLAAAAGYWYRGKVQRPASPTPATNEVA